MGSWEEDGYMSKPRDGCVDQFHACMSKPRVQSLGCLCGLDSSQSSAACQQLLK